MRRRYADWSDDITWAPSLGARQYAGHHGGLTTSITMQPCDPEKYHGWIALGNGKNLVEMFE
jgi:hypothetical protein